jgi:hypothetical protein
LSSTTPRYRTAPPSNTTLTLAQMSVDAIRATTDAVTTRDRAPESALCAVDGSTPADYARRKSSVRAQHRDVSFAPNGSDEHSVTPHSRRARTRGVGVIPVVLGYPEGLLIGHSALSNDG